MQGFRAGAVSRHYFQRIAQVDCRLQPLRMSDGPLVVVNEESRWTDGPLLLQSVFIVNRCGHGVGGTRAQSSLVLHGRTQPPQVHALGQAFADMFRFWRIEVIARIRTISYKRIARVCRIHRAVTTPLFCLSVFRQYTPASVFRAMEPGAAEQSAAEPTETAARGVSAARVISVSPRRAVLHSDAPRDSKTSKSQNGPVPRRGGVRDTYPFLSSSYSAAVVRSAREFGGLGK